MKATVVDSISNAVSAPMARRCSPAYSFNDVFLLGSTEITYTMAATKKTNGMALDKLGDWITDLPIFCALAL